MQDRQARNKDPYSQSEDEDSPSEDQNGRYDQYVESPLTVYIYIYNLFLFRVRCTYVTYYIRER